MEPVRLEGFDVTHAPPSQLKKAMKWRWAKALQDSGLIRLKNVLEYRKPSSSKPWQTDPFEDMQIEDNDGVVCTAESMTPPFVWCASCLDADSDRLMEIDHDYDTIVTILNPPVFFQRIRDEVWSSAPWGRFQVGNVRYDKGGPATAYFWGKCTFQKHAKYSYQREYRLAFHESPGLKRGKPIRPVYKDVPHVDLKVGCCLDVVKMERRNRTRRRTVRLRRP